MTDENEVLTIVRIGMEMQFYLLKGSVKAILQLFQLMKRMEKKKLFLSRQKSLVTRWTIGLICAM